MKTININGKDYTVEELTKILDDAKKVSPMQRVFEYHNTTEEEFDKLYQNLPKHVKSFEKECMVVAYYNKGWKPDFNNSKEYKYYPWFYMNDFRLNCVYFYVADSDCSARALFKNEEDCKEAVKEFFEVFKESRLNL